MDIIDLVSHVNYKFACNICRINDISALDGLLISPHSSYSSSYRPSRLRVPTSTTRSVETALGSCQVRRQEAAGGAHRHAGVATLYHPAIR